MKTQEQLEEDRLQWLGNIRYILNGNYQLLYKLIDERTELDKKLYDFEKVNNEKQTH